MFTDKSSLIKIRTGSSTSLPVFCVPGAGAGVSAFLELAAAMGPEFSFYGMQSYGVGGIRDWHDSVEAAASSYIVELRKMFKAGPYYLVGHSFGGWVVFEMAKQLIECGDKVGLLLILDSSPPLGMRKEDFSFKDRITSIVELCSLYNLIAEWPISVKAEDLERLDSREQIGLFRDQLLKRKLITSGVTLDFLEELVLDFERKINTVYRPKGLCKAPLHLVLASDNSSDVDQMGKAHKMVEGWRDHASKVIPINSHGNHLTLLKKDNLHHVVKVINSIYTSNV
jgi:thioesterase domain-containing protein